ncbi:cytochrome P450 [Mycolicibacterium confluentis]
MEDYCADAIEKVRRDPQPGVIAAYLEAEDRGDITRRETTASIMLFLATGHFSTATLAAHGLERMASDPELFAAFRDDPAVRPKVINELLRFVTLERMASDPELFAAFRDDPAVRPKVINELLRFVTPETGVTRLTLEDVEVAGTVLPAGSTVYVLLASANRDERVFADPDRFDYHRSPFCPLARRSTSSSHQPTVTSVCLQTQTGSITTAQPRDVSTLRLLLGRIRVWGRSWRAKQPTRS